MGPHGRTVKDTAILLDVLAGYSVEDPKTVASIGMIPAGGYAAALSAGALKGARLGVYGPGWRDQPLSEEAKMLYEASLAELAGQGAILVEDPFAGTDFAGIARKDVEFDDRGLESIAYDMEHYLRRLGPSAAAHSFAGLKALVPEDPFSPGGALHIHVQYSKILEQSLKDPTSPPDLSEFLAVRLRYLEVFNATMALHNLDALAFPQMSGELPGVFTTLMHPATTVSEINIAGLPGVTAPAGQFRNGSPFSLIFVGRMWSEAALLNLAYAFEQSTQHRIVPVLVEKEA